MSSFDANTAGNLQEVEMQFAVKTVEHLEAYEKLITSIPPNKLKLTPIDDELHAHLLEVFPHFKDTAELQDLNENKMKSATGKENWRNFIMTYEKTLTDYNFGTLIRRDAKQLYGEDNTVLVTRAQFVALEVARNRAGVNDHVYQQAQAAKKA